MIGTHLNVTFDRSTAEQHQQQHDRVAAHPRRWRRPRRRDAVGRPGRVQHPHGSSLHRGVRTNNHVRSARTRYCDDRPVTPLHSSDRPVYPTPGTSSRAIPLMRMDRPIDLVYVAYIGHSIIGITTLLRGLTQAMALWRGVQDAYDLTGSYQTQEELVLRDGLSVDARIDQVKAWVDWQLAICDERSVIIFGEAGRAVNGSHGSFVRATVNGMATTVASLRAIACRLREAAPDQPLRITLKALTTLPVEHTFSSRRTSNNSSNKGVVAYSIDRERGILESIRKMSRVDDKPVKPGREVTRIHARQARRRQYDAPKPSEVVYDEVNAVLNSVREFATRREQRRAAAQSPRLSEADDVVLRQLVQLIKPERQQATRERSKKPPNTRLTILGETSASTTMDVDPTERSGP